MKLQGLEGYQHAAIDVTLHLSATTGAVSRLVIPKRLHIQHKLQGVDADKYEEWATSTWRHRFEAFDAECITACLEAQEVCDPHVGRHRGCLPKKATVQPKRKPVGTVDTLWDKFAAWLKWLGNLADAGHCWLSGGRPHA